MSNTSKGPASKGSKYQIQKMAKPNNKHYLDEELGDILTWISPIDKDGENYSEYLLNNKKICNIIGIKPTMFKEKWPSQQPQWDGIAMGASGTLYLFEAKSHLTEIAPRGNKRRNKENDQMIAETIKEAAFNLFGRKIENIEDEIIWTNKYYQISNRLAFTHLLRGVKSEKYNNVVMVFLNFVNDKTWQKDKKMVPSAEIWEEHYKTILNRMGITKRQLEKENIRIINFDLDAI